MDIVENNYEYDNEGMNEFGYIHVKITYVRLFVILVMFNVYFIYYMYNQIHLQY